MGKQEESLFYHHKIGSKTEDDYHRAIFVRRFSRTPTTSVRELAWLGRRDSGEEVKSYEVISIK